LVRRSRTPYWAQLVDAVLSQPVHPSQLRRFVDLAVFTGVGWLFVGFADAIRGVGAVTIPFQVAIRRSKIPIQFPNLDPVRITGSSY